MAGAEEPTTLTPRTPASSRPHVVIVGGGLAGLNEARALTGRAVDVTVLDCRMRFGTPLVSEPRLAEQEKTLGSVSEA